MSSKNNHYNLLVLGSGEAGKYLAWTLASHYPPGKVALIESTYLGGSCPNIACLPSKNFIHTANLIHTTSQASSYGMPSDVNGDVDMKIVRQRKREMVEGLVKMHEGRFKESGVEVIWGIGRFTADKTIEVENGKGEKRVVTADKIIISTGSRAMIYDIPGLKASDPLTHISLLELDVVPSHLVILGGGYIGLEFAQAVRRLGAEVTIIERSERILGKEDEDVVEALISIFKGDGVKFCNQTVITEVSGKSGESVTLRGVSKEGKFEITGSHILCATGRVPNTDNIGLEKAGIKLTERHFIETNARLETSQIGIYAVGDCAGSPNFTHIAFDDFRIVRDAILGKVMPEARKSALQIPFTLFTTPELAHIGLREHEAKTKRIRYRQAKLPMAGFLKTRTLGDTTGFAKVLVGDDDRILGFTALGPGAGELLPVVQLAVKTGLPYSDIADMVITHPTLSEGLVYLFMKVPPKN